ncbi:hypothetical protein K501DRAFT_264050 [Backusella circina FSU 941]|nr:hypothetical protein K501DRAFT_264050 [Backusella circina FSU 941]
MKLYVPVVLSLVSTALAFESTVPLLMWSPKDYVNTDAKTNSNQFVIAKEDANNAILSSFSSNICSAKVVAFVDQPEIHCNDFSRSEYENAFNQLKAHSSQSDTRVQMEYISEGVDIHEVAKEIAKQCDSAIAILDPFTVSVDDISSMNGPTVAIVPLSPADNANTLQQNDATLGRLIDTIEKKTGNDYVVVYTSSTAKAPKRSANLHRRAPTVKPIDNRPIFAKYVLFTPGIFMVLGVVFLFLFIAVTGLTWLVGIQTPVRFEGKQKKN